MDRKRSSASNDAEDAPLPKRAPSKIEHIMDRLKTKTYDSLLKQMEIEKQWSPEFRQKIITSFTNCAYEGRKVTEECEKMLANSVKMESEYVVAIKASDAEIKSLKNQITEKDQKIERIQDEARIQIEARKNEIKLVEAKMQCSEKSVTNLNQRLQEEKEKAQKIERESEKQMEEWKKEYQDQHDAKLMKQKELFKMISEIPEENQPCWIVPKNICNAIYESHQKNCNLFVFDFVKRLFTLGEIVLPQKKLKHEKIQEATAVLKFYFYKFSLNEKTLDEALNKARSEARQIYYQKVNKNGIIAITNDGESYFYSKDSFERFIPFKDPQCNVRMNACIFHEKYGIPDIYRNYGFILIIHISPSDGIQHNYLHAGSGYLEENIHSVSKVEKKEKG